MALADKAASVVAAWTLDEASGARVDQVGSSDLTDNNTVASAVGQFSNAADFERSNSEFLSAASSATLQAGDIDFMLRCWVKFESTPASGQGYSIITKDVNTPANSRDYTLDCNNNAGTIRFRFYVNGGAGGLIVTASNFGAPSAGVWYLIHAWHDATNNLLGISINAGTANTATTGGTAPQTSTAQFRIGARAFATAEDYFDGLIDDPLLMKGAFLDATERTEDYNSGTGVAFADWAGGGGASIVPLDEGMLRGGFQNMTGGLA